MKNLLLGGLVSAASVVGLQSCDGATIGGTPVPSDLHCQEDEAIQFIGIDTLGCVHIDIFAQVECDDFEIAGEVICVDGRTGRVLYPETEVSSDGPIERDS